MGGDETVDSSAKKSSWKLSGKGKVCTVRLLGSAQADAQGTGNKYPSRSLTQMLGRSPVECALSKSRAPDT